MKKRVSKIFKVSVSIFLIIIIGLFTFCFVNKQNGLKEIQSEKVQELIENEGLYDEKNIILSDTNREKAQEIADTINAKVRISSDGKFAALTLPDDVTIMDIFRSDEVLSSLNEMSPDYSVSLNESEEAMSSS